MKFVYYLLSVSVLLASCNNQKKENADKIKYDSKAYVGVNLIDVNTNKIRKNSTIVVKNGIIENIGDSDEIFISKNTKVVDTKDKWVIPGLIDMHAHVTVLPLDSNLIVIDKYDKKASFEALKTLLAFGITTVRNPAAPTKDAIELRDLVNNKRIVGPTIYTSGFALNRTKAFFGPFSATVTEDEIRQEIKNQIQHGVDFIKVYGSLKPDQIKIAIDEAHKNGKRVVGHLQNTSWSKAADMGIDFITHAAPWNKEYLPKKLQSNYRPTFKGRLFWLENVDYSGNSIREMIATLIENRVSIDPTLIVFHTKFWGDDKKYTDSEYLKLAPNLVTSIWNKTNFTSSWTEKDYSRAKKQWKKLTELTRLMFEKGVLITAGSDFPNPWVVPGISLHQELHLLVDAGIPNMEVLKIATINGAKALNIENKTGSIEIGKQADLVFLNANPLENIENTKKIAFVLNNGIYYDPVKLNKHISSLNLN